jgi:hypothetical protein
VYVLLLQVAVKVMPKQRGKLTKERTLQKLAKEVGSSTVAAGGQQDGLWQEQQQLVAAADARVTYAAASQEHQFSSSSSSSSSVRPSCSRAAAVLVVRSIQQQSGAMVPQQRHSWVQNAGNGHLALQPHRTRCCVDLLSCVEWVVKLFVPSHRRRHVGAALAQHAFVLSQCAVVAGGNPSEDAGVPQRGAPAGLL